MRCRGPRSCKVDMDATLSSLSSAAFFEFLSAPTRTALIPSHLRGFPNWGVPAKLDLAVFVLFKARPPTHLFFRIIDQSIPLLQHFHGGFLADAERAFDALPPDVEWIN